ncbi:hypothetical protein JCM3765_007149 [Sporobolomyces pararoseus]
MPSRHLPTELLEDIFSQLSSSKSALYNLSLSCRTFYFLCKPFLYSHITIVTRVQRERLMQVRKEDAKLVRKLVIKGRARAPGSNCVDGTECTVGSNIIEDIFSGKLLNISALETLHLAHLYENAYHQQGPETLDLISASNLVELSIHDHDGGGPFWEHFFAERENSPKLVCVGEYGISSYRPKIDLDSEGNSFLEFKAVTAYGTLIPLTRRSRLNAYACWPFGSTERDAKKLAAITIESSDNLSLLAHCVRWCGHSYWVPTSTLTTPSIDSCRELLVQLKSHDIKAPTFLSFPFSRSDFTLDILSVFSSIEDLGLEVHFSLDEEEEDSISLIPRSFVDFVRLQEKLKEEEDKEKDNVVSRDEED